MAVLENCSWNLCFRQNLIIFFIMVSMFHTWGLHLHITLFRMFQKGICHASLKSIFVGIIRSLPNRITITNCHHLECFLENKFSLQQTLVKMAFQVFFHLGVWFHLWITSSVKFKLLGKPSSGCRMNYWELSSYAISFLARLFGT